MSVQIKPSCSSYVVQLKPQAPQQLVTVQLAAPHVFQQVIKVQLAAPQAPQQLVTVQLAAPQAPVVNSLGQIVIGGAKPQEVIPLASLNPIVRTPAVPQAQLLTAVHKLEALVKEQAAKIDELTKKLASETAAKEALQKEVTILTATLEKTQKDLVELRTGVVALAADVNRIAALLQQYS